MLSSITISALRFATFCLFVEVAMIILRQKIQEEIKNRKCEEIKNQLFED